MRTIAAAALAAALAAYAVAGVAHVPSAKECRQAGQFIYDAARSREDGITRKQFIGQMLSDFQTILAFPKKVRWFVKDKSDEKFLLSAAENVYDHPQAPAAHRRAFLARCRLRMASAQ